jgi:hypothetical protein
METGHSAIDSVEALESSEDFGLIARLGDKFINLSRNVPNSGHNHAQINNPIDM